MGLAHLSGTDRLALAYALVTFLLLFATVGAWAPRALGRTLAPVFGLAGMIVTFFLPHAIALGIAVTTLVWRFGGFAHPGAFVALALGASCWVALGTLLFRMHRALPVLDGEPVGDADQPFCRGLTEDERRLLPAGRVSWQATLLIRSAARARAKVTKKVVFRRVGKVSLALDVYRPKEPTAPRPALVYIHGGGWFSGTRAQSRFLLYELAAAGWTVFTTSYRHAPFHPLPAAVEDCKAAIAWVRAHAAEYGADGARIFVLGGSAGGHLAALMALAPNLPRFQPGFEDADTTVQGAVVLYGVTDLAGAFGERPHPALRHLLERFVVRQRFADAPDLFRALDPLGYVGPAAPPTLLVHGTADAVVPIEHSRLMHERLQQAGVRAHLLEVPLGHHAFEVFPTPLHQRAVRVIVRFLEALRAEG